MGIEIIYGILFIFVFVIYFLPSISAYCDNHKQRDSIIILNIFLGWTIVGWVIALVWAFKEEEDVPHQKKERKSKEKPNESALSILKKRFAEGKITEEEYNKKKQILKEK